jgi:hypothetical protein
LALSLGTVDGIGLVLDRVARCVPYQELREATEMDDGIGSTPDLKCISSAIGDVLAIATIKRSHYNAMKRYIATVEVLCYVLYSTIEQ